MSKFHVGDRVERIGSLVPEYMKNGTITAVTVNEDGFPAFDEYEVDFSERAHATLYETQLQQVSSHKD